MVDTSFIKAVVMAEDVAGDGFEPVRVVSSYDPGQRVLHAVVTLENAPKATTLKAIWLATDVGRVAAPDSTIDQTSVTTEGSRNIDFSLTPVNGIWPPGSYRVEIYANSYLARTAPFSVRASAAATQPAPSGGIVQQAVLCRDVAPDTFEPVGVTPSFAPDDKRLHFVVQVRDAPPNTTFTADWFFGDKQVSKATLTTGGSLNVHFTLDQSQPWPAGTYHVDLYVNGQLERTVNFTVR